jgi:hypothetical protein
MMYCKNFVNVTMYPQYNNKKRESSGEKPGKPHLKNNS